MSRAHATVRAASAAVSGQDAVRRLEVTPWGAPHRRWLTRGRAVCSAQAESTSAAGAAGDASDTDDDEDDDGDSGFIETESGLFMRDVTVGRGPVPQPGEKVTIHYSVFEASEVRPLESTWKTGFPFAFWVGDNRALKGVDEAVRSMRVGGRRELIVPPALGFGRRSQPPDMTLLIELDLLRIGEAGAFMQFMRRWFGSPEGDTDQGDGMTPPVPRKAKGDAVEEGAAVGEAAARVDDAGRASGRG
uniref:peptidylprolyl isomerase n=1 Tax=Bicosoecida sp. CB-2014 TaxID=1486930 RepID=A0A7S1G991_9STRA